MSSVFMLIVGLVVFRVGLGQTTTSSNETDLDISELTPITSPSPPTTTLSLRDQTLIALNFTSLGEECFQLIQRVDGCLNEALLIGREPTAIPQSLVEIDDYC